MNMNRNLPSDYDAILMECLDAVVDGQLTVDECLRRYPEYAEQLRPTLRLATNLHKAQVVRPSLSFRKQAPARLQSRLQQSARKPLPRQGRNQHKAGGWLGNFAFRGAIAVMLVAIIASTTGLAAYAADNSVPGEMLYQLDIAVEQAQLSFTSSPEQVLALNIEIANERLTEAETLIIQGDSANADAALSHYDETVTQIIVAAEQVAPEEQAEAATEVEASLSRNQQRLQELLDQVPEQAQHGIQRAIEASQQGRENNNGNGSNANPGNGNGAGNSNGNGNATSTNPGNGNGNGNNTGTEQPSDSGESGGGTESSGNSNGNSNGNGTSGASGNGNSNGNGNAGNSNSNGNSNGNGNNDNDQKNGGGNE